MTGVIRYSAQYVTREALDLGGDVEMSTIVGTDLGKVVATAKKRNYPCDDECYHICRETKDQHGNWNPAGFYTLSQLESIV